MADEIFYSGPKREYVPQDGANRESSVSTEVSLIQTSFADTDYLLKLLTLIRAESRANIYLMEAELNTLVLNVKREASDDQLRSALAEEWPTNQGAVKDYVPYPYYKSLEARESASATYIRKRWQDAARDIGGPSSFDLVQPLYVIRDEAEVVVDFLARYVGNVDDSSEERIVELLQEWAAVALASVRTFGAIFSTKATETGFSAAELDTLSAEEASQYQAIFAVKVNEANVMLDQTITSFNKSYAAYTDPFYSRVLGPALQFRLNASRKIYPGSTQIAKSANLAAESLNMNLSLLITDMMRRNTTFTSKMNEINDSIALRDRYRYYVRQLAAIGRPAATTAIVQSPIPLNPDDWFDPILETATPTTYSPSHLKLTDTDDINTHSWALDRFGRNRIEADVEVKPGVRVGGVVLAEHRHDGSDGSQPIKGINIDGLRADTIDRDIQLSPPTELRLIKTQSSVTGRTVDAHVAWDGDSTHLFDIQVTPIVDSMSDSFKRVYRGSPGDYSVGIQTYDGSYFYVPRVDQLDDEAGASTRMVKVVPNGSETLEFAVLDLLDFYEESLGTTEIDDTQALYVGIQDHEVAASGDIYFAGPAQLSLNVEGVPIPLVAKYSTSDSSFTALYRVGSDNTELEAKLYSSVTCNMAKTQIFVQGILIDSDEPVDPAYSTQMYVGLVGGDTIEKLGDAIPDGPILMVSDYCSDGYIYGIGALGVGEGSEDDDMVMVKVDPNTGEQSVIGNGEAAVTFPSPAEANMYSLVALESEFIYVNDFQVYSIKKDLSSIVNLTPILGFNPLGVGMPAAVCKDRYGRVYASTMPNNDIYRICGPSGTGIF